MCVENKFLLVEELAFLENHMKLDALTEADEITSYHKSFLEKVERKNVMGDTAE